MTDELSRLLCDAWEYNMTNIHTVFPGKAVRYDPKTRRADIQPSLKRRLPDGNFVDFPIIPDVPVLYPGTSEYTIHFPLKKDDEVEIRVCERSTDVWRDSGDKGIEDTDPRRFSLQDCIAVPGLQPVHFIPTEEKGLAIIHQTNWDGDFISSIAMDDAAITMQYKQKCRVKMEEDHLAANTEKCSVDMTADTVTVKNSQITAELNGAKASLKNGGKSLYTIWHTFLTNLRTIKPATLGSPGQHNLNPLIEQAIKTADTDLGSVLEA